MPVARVVVLDLVCLTAEHLADATRTPTLNRLARKGWSAPMTPPFPAVTCPAQATLTTGSLPREHGVIANGLYERDRFAVRFWDQPTSMVHREKIWERLRRERPGSTSALLFFQNTMFASAEVVVTPAPLHLDEGLVPWCYSKPVRFYEDALVPDLGEFELPWYWGPLAGAKASEWIVRAALRTLERMRPTLTMAYLPHLDYNTQRFGPESPQFQDDLARMDQLVGEFLDGLGGLGMADDTAVVLCSEYAMAPVSRPVLLNRALRQAGLLNVRTIGGREYPDLELSPAFAMVDHQIAHLYLKAGSEAEVRATLERTSGVERVLGAEEKAVLGIDHPNSGDLIAVAEPDAWFAYYWWLDDALAPPYAHEVDIHRKPAYDPCELFFDPQTRSIPLAPERIRGSHGRPAGDEPTQPLLIFSGPGSGPASREPVQATEFPDLVLGLLR